MLIFFMVFEVLNRLEWKDGLEGVEIIILHRGAPGNRKVIRGEELTEIKRSYLVYGIDIPKGCQEVAGRFHGATQISETEIPLHRIREVRKDGKTIWKRKGKED